MGYLEDNAYEELGLKGMEYIDTYKTVDKYIMTRPSQTLTDLRIHFPVGTGGPHHLKENTHIKLVLLV
jgi:hypothetical protein